MSKTPEQPWLQKTIVKADLNVLRGWILPLGSVYGDMQSAHKHVHGPRKKPHVTATLSASLLGGFQGYLGGSLPAWLRIPECCPLAQHSPAPTHLLGLTAPRSHLRHASVLEEEKAGLCPRGTGQGGR